MPMRNLSNASSISASVTGWPNSGRMRLWNSSAPMSPRSSEEIPLLAVDAEKIVCVGHAELAERVYTTVAVEIHYDPSEIE